MNVPQKHELIHLQFQAMLREHSIPDLKYLGQREYTDEYESHPEFHGQLMHWYRLENHGDPIEIPVCDFIQVDSVEEDD